MLIKKRVEILKEEYEMKDAIEIHWRFDSNWEKREQTSIKAIAHFCIR